jgi:hypothetical protein
MGYAGTAKKTGKVIGVGAKVRLIAIYRFLRALTANAKMPANAADKTSGTFRPSDGVCCVVIAAGKAGT